MKPPWWHCAPPPPRGLPYMFTMIPAGDLDCCKPIDRLHKVPELIRSDWGPAQQDSGWGQDLRVRVKGKGLRRILSFARCSITRNHLNSLHCLGRQ